MAFAVREFSIEVTLNAVPNASSAFVIWSQLLARAVMAQPEPYGRYDGQQRISKSVADGKQSGPEPCHAPRPVDCGLILLGVSGANLSVTRRQNRLWDKFTKWTMRVCVNQYNVYTSLGADTAVVPAVFERRRVRSGKDSSERRSRGRGSTTPDVWSNGIDRCNRVYRQRRCYASSGASKICPRSTAACEQG